MIDQLKLAEGYARRSWKYATNWLAAAAIAFGTWAVSDPVSANALMQHLLSYVPDALKPVIPPALLFVWWWLRGTPQGRGSANPEPTDEG